MHITIQTPEMLLSERARLLKAAVDLLRGQQKSNQRYAQRLNNIANKILEIDKQLGG